MGAELKLLPCPFCGLEALFAIAFRDAMAPPRATRHVVTCPNDRCAVTPVTKPRSTRALASRAWNRRVDGR